MLNNTNLRGNPGSRNARSGSNRNITQGSIRHHRQISVMSSSKENITLQTQKEKAFPRPMQSATISEFGGDQK